MVKRMFSGVPGILRPFKEYLESQHLVHGDQVVYYGVPGTCTPFIELLAFAVRGLELEQIFVPHFEEGKAKMVVSIPDVGMQVSHAMPGPLRPKVVVILGGLSMPNVPVTVEDARRTLEKFSGVPRVGVCFMNMFEKAGWIEPLGFAVVIDAKIDPVEVTG